MEKITLSIAETAEALGASKATVGRWIRDGEIPSVRFGRRVLVPKDALAKVIKDQLATHSARRGEKDC